MKKLTSSEIVALRQCIAYRIDNDTLTKYQRKQLIDINIKLFNNQVNLHIDKINAS